MTDHAVKVYHQLCWIWPMLVMIFFVGLGLLLGWFDGEDEK